MSRIVKFGVLLFVAILISNCKPNELDPSVIINVEDDFYINMFEDISNGENKFHITIQSIQEQNCLNSNIDYDLEFDGVRNLIIISINDIIPPETCIEGNAPAFVSIPIEDVEKRDYTVEINLKDVIINHGDLIVSDMDYYLGMSTENGFEVVHKRLIKIPKKTIWGYVGYEEEAEKIEAENFIKDLDDLSTDISEVEGYDIGYFGYFTMLEDRSIEIEDEVDEKFHESFIFSYDADYQDIINLIANYCNQPSELKIYLFNGEGEQIECQ